MFDSRRGLNLESDYCITHTVTEAKLCNNMQSDRLIVNINSDYIRGMSPRARMTVSYKEWTAGPVHTDGEKKKQGRKSADKVTSEIQRDVCRWLMFWYELDVFKKEVVIVAYWGLTSPKNKMSSFTHVILTYEFFLSRNTKGDVSYNVDAALFQSMTAYCEQELSR